MGAYKKLFSRRIKDLSDTGLKELSEVYSLRKYLNEFSLISERETYEVSIWDNYLIYGTLFGIANKVIKQFKKLYPEKNYEFDRMSTNIDFAMNYFYALYMTAHNIIAARNRELEQARWSSGSGGSISFVGGGRFSGGGSGGGSR